MNSKKIIKKCLNHLYKNIGEHNTGILVTILTDATDYACGEKGLKEVRSVEVKFNDLHTTKCVLKDFSYTH